VWLLHISILVPDINIINIPGPNVKPIPDEKTMYFQGSQSPDRNQVLRTCNSVISNIWQSGKWKPNILAIYIELQAG
jgi:hypothetical protein